MTPKSPDQLFIVARRLLALATLLITVTYLVLTFYELIFHGWCENADVNAPHFSIGAGNGTLKVRYNFCVAAVVSLCVWTCFTIKVRVMLAKVLVAVSCILLYYYTAYGLERISPTFDIDAFNDIEYRYWKGQTITVTEVSSRLGAPLAKGCQNSCQEEFGEHELWLYSYMPSCGFGWVIYGVYMDKQGKVLHVYRMKEP